MEPLFWPIVLLLAGLFLIVLELFIPSGGLLSLLAAAAIVAAIVLGFLASVQMGVIMLALTAVVIPAILAAAVKWWPHTPIGKLILIHRPEHPDDVLPASEAYRGLPDLVGRRGITRTKMLPSGVVLIGGKTYDAVSEGMPIDAGQAVLVTRVSTQRLIVRPAEGLPSPSDLPTDDVLSQPIDALGLEGLGDPRD
jgi:membrane-bound serine protease (ClpP class)